jgi:hypothetical protein
MSRRGIAKGILGLILNPDVEHTRSLMTDPSGALAPDAIVLLKGLATGVS